MEAILVKDQKAAAFVMEDGHLRVSIESQKRFVGMWSRSQVSARRS